jgi:hypothetical protein
MFISSHIWKMFFFYDNQFSRVTRWNVLKAIKNTCLKLSDKLYGYNNAIISGNVVSFILLFFCTKNAILILKFIGNSASVWVYILLIIKLSLTCIIHKLDYYCFCKMKVWLLLHFMFLSNFSSVIDNDI